MQDFKTSENFTTVFGAIQEVSTALGAMVRNREVNVGKYDFKYIDLNTLLAELKPLLRANGITFTPFPCGEGGLLFRITHLDTSEYIQTYYKYPAPIKNTQDQGGVITYMTRYALMSIFNVEAYEDNDGVVSTSDSKAFPTLLPKTEEWNTIIADLESGKATLEVILSQYSTTKSIAALLKKYANKAKTK